MPEPKIIRLQSSEQEYVIQDLEPNSKYDIEISSAPRPPCDENNSIVRSPVFQGLCVTNPSGNWGKWLFSSCLNTKYFNYKTNC